MQRDRDCSWRVGRAASNVAVGIAAAIKRRDLPARPTEFHDRSAGALRGVAAQISNSEDAGRFATTTSFGSVRHHLEPRRQPNAVSGRRFELLPVRIDQQTRQGQDAYDKEPGTQTKEPSGEAELPQGSKRSSWGRGRERPSSHAATFAYGPPSKLTVLPVVPRQNFGSSRFRRRSSIKRRTNSTKIAMVRITTAYSEMSHSRK